ncbi:MAG: hypothetical protein WBD74_07680 [Candidatus Aquilonibacter sp.]
MNRSHVLGGALGAVIVLGVFTACGGGGGGGSSPIPTNAPSGAPTSAPSGAPTSSASAAPTATPTSPGASTQTITTGQGVVDGEPNMFTPTEGDTPSGGQGPSPVDGISCAPTMSNNYHVHIFLGVYVNGQEMALPIAIGMENPGAPSAGFINTATCFYYIHTHDSSGIVHIEDPNPNNVPMTGTIFTLQNVLDVWGVTTDAKHFGPFTGPVEVFTSGQVYRGDQNNQLVPSTDLTYWGSNANTIPLYSHEVIYIEVGPTYPTTLPNVSFYLEY